MVQAVGQLSAPDAAPSHRRSTKSFVSIVVLAIATVACNSPSLSTYGPGLARNERGDLYLIAAPCRATPLNTLSILEVDEGGSESPVLSVSFDPPMKSWDVVIPLDPLDLGQPGLTVDVFDEAAFEKSLVSTDDRFQVFTEGQFSTNGETEQSNTRFAPGLLTPNTMIDADELFDDPQQYGCERGAGKPWRDAFENQD